MWIWSPDPQQQQPRGTSSKAMTCQLRKTLSPTPGRDPRSSALLMCRSTGASAAPCPPSIGVRTSSHFTYDLRASVFSTLLPCSAALTGWSGSTSRARLPSRRPSVAGGECCVRAPVSLRARRRVREGAPWCGRRLRARTDVIIGTGVLWNTLVRSFTRCVRVTRS